MAHTFKFHVRHGSDPFRKGIGHLHVDDETIRLELPTLSEEHTQTSPAIRNVMLCDTSQRFKERLRTWICPGLEIDFSRSPIFLTFSLIILMVPVPTTLPWEWVFKGIAVAGCFFYSLVVPLARLLIEFEDDTYVCGDIAESILEAHHTQIFR